MAAGNRNVVKPHCKYCGGGGGGGGAHVHDFQTPPTHPLRGSIVLHLDHTPLPLPHSLLLLQAEKEKMFNETRWVWSLVMPSGRVLTLALVCLKGII